jgi:threonine 3-dehydrogenase
MSEKMPALVKESRAPGLVLKEVPVPQAGPGQVKIRVKKTAICGTDVHIYKWDEWSQRTLKPPLTVGHEFVGEIAELGEGVEGFAPGEIVSGEGHVVCGECRNCRAGRRHLCPNTVGVGVNRDGCFAQYLVIPASNVVRVAPGISLDIAACFDPFGNAVHTALKFDLTGEDVLVTGAGPIGIMAAAVARHCGARAVAITDVNKYRLDLAKALVPGVFAADPRETGIKKLSQDMGAPEGFGVGLEMSGNPSAFCGMIEGMRNGGKIAMLGILPSAPDVNWDKIVFGGLTLQGIYGREMYETWHKMMAMLQGGLDINGIVTHRFGFRDFEKGFEAMTSGSSGKVVLDWEQ